MKNAKFKIFFLFLILIQGFATLPVSYVFANFTPPQTVHYFTPEFPSGTNGWFTSAVKIKLLSTDLQSGVNSINYKIDEGEWKKETFSETLNLFTNASFEEGDYWTLSGWEHPYYSWWKAKLRQDFWVAKFGERSASIKSFSDGQYYWTNRNYYAITKPFNNYTLNLWVKTQEVVGSGANFQVWAKRASGSDLKLFESEQILGTKEWTNLSTQFYVPYGFEGIYIQLSLEGFGSVWWDGIEVYEGSKAEVSFNVATDGEHSLSYYSTDRAEPANIEKTAGPINFKIDSQSPNWQNLKLTREPSYSDNTFDISITVSDPTSGIDIKTGFYSYSLDGGEIWTDWLPIEEYFPNISGAKEVTLRVREIDFKDSNKRILKLIRFKISDLAGLESTTPMRSLNTLWFNALLPEEEIEE